MNTSPDNYRLIRQMQLLSFDGQLGALRRHPAGQTAGRSLSGAKQSIAFATRRS